MQRDSNSGIRYLESGIKNTDPELGRIRDLMGPLIFFEKSTKMFSEVIIWG